jgi:DNA-binding transcriptional LysR family regulator
MLNAPGGILSSVGHPGAMSPRELKLEPSIALKIGRATLTIRQLEVLRAIYEEGSQNRAAARLGIATAVLNRYLAHIESKVGTSLSAATPRGTTLNEEGERITLEYIALSRRMATAKGTVIGGTMVTEEMLLNTLTNADPDRECDLIISDDRRNLQDFRAGLMDIVVLDDPLYLFDLEGVKWQEVAARGPRAAVRFLPIWRATDRVPASRERRDALRCHPHLSLARADGLLRTELLPQRVPGLAAGDEDQERHRPRPAGPQHQRGLSQGNPPGAQAGRRDAEAGTQSIT